MLYDWPPELIWIPVVSKGVPLPPLRVAVDEAIDQAGAGCPGVTAVLRCTGWR